VVSLLSLRGLCLVDVDAEADSKHHGEDEEERVDHDHEDHDASLGDRVGHGDLNLLGRVSRGSGVLGRDEGRVAGLEG